MNNDVEIVNFNLHGCLVIDNFAEISVCPSKGLVSSLKTFAPYDPIASESWLNAELAGLGLLQSPGICVVPLVLSSAFIEELKHSINPSRSDVKGFPSAVTRHSIKLAEVLIKKRQFLSKLKTSENSDDNKSSSLRFGAKSVLSKFSKAISRKKSPSPVSNLEKDAELDCSDLETEIFEDALSEPTDWSKSGGSGVIIDDNDTAEADPRSDYLGEVGHVAEFLSTVDYCETSTLSSTSKEILNSIMNLLLELEKQKNCEGIVLDILVPENSRDILNSFVKQFPKYFRTDLRIPAVAITSTKAVSDEMRESIKNGGIVRMAICPIPLKKGDHIFREIRDKGALKLATHHGIYTGNARVIHFSGNEFSLVKLFAKQRNAKVRSVSIIDFMKHGSRLRTIKYKLCDNVDTTIHRAEEALVEQSFPNYDIFKNNCEHFCYYCKTGKARSKQVEKGIQYTAAAAGTVVLTAAVVGIAMALSRRKFRILVNYLTGN